MDQSTQTLFDELIRHAKGMISSLEKWVARQKQESQRMPPPSERENNDRLPA